MKIVAFLGDTFDKSISGYHTMAPNSRFLQQTFGVHNVLIVSPFRLSDLDYVPNSTVDPSKFLEAPMPSRCTTYEFYKRWLLNKAFRQTFIRFSDNIIDNNPDAVFWARTPSPGSMIFALRVVKKKQRLIQHVCGDASLTWRDSKYSSVMSILAFLFSRVVLFQHRQIARSSKTLNLATGSRIFNRLSKYSTEVFQFVDSISEGKDVSIGYDHTSCYTLTFIGRIVRDKGVFDLILACERLLKELNQFTLNIVGNGPDMMELKTFVKERGLGKCVSFHGVRSTSEIQEILLKTHTVIVPSQTNEGFPRVIMEAWSYNIPVIVSNVGGVSAFVYNDINGMIFPPRNVNILSECIYKLITDNAYRGILIDNIKRNRANYTGSHWSAMLKRVANEKFAE